MPKTNRRLAKTYEMTLLRDELQSPARSAKNTLSAALGWLAR